MFFTTKEAAEISGCSLRQLQYWREKRVVVPTVDATGKGRSVFYTRDDLVSLAVMGYLLSAGLEYTEACAGLEALKQEEPEFYKPSVTKRYLLSRNTEDNSLILTEFDVEAVHGLLRMGNPVIPLWLDRIHEELGNNLTRLERFKQDNQNRTSGA